MMPTLIEAPSPGRDRSRRPDLRRLQVACTALCLLGLADPVAGAAAADAAASVPAQPGQVSFTGVERVVAFADVHGAYEELTELLKTARVVDGGLRWSAGRTHLVCTGDMLDRGADSRKVMDLLMRLQDEAQAAGGQVHVTLGNHEAMNLLGNVRDVAPGELEAYAADEPAGVREKARAEWIARNGADSGGRFDTRFPVGYFGHRAALAPDGTYGRWLFALPVAIMINDTLFMHGGPSPVLKGLTLSDVNLRHRTALTDYLTSVAALEAAGLVLPEDDFGQRATLAEQRLAARSSATPADQARDAEAVRRFVAADANPMIGADGPNWYRGAAMCNACSETDVLKPLLAGLSAKRLVIGHTVTHDALVASRFDGTVIKLDTGMNHAVYRGRASALILEQGSARVIYAGEPQASGAIAPEDLYVSSGTLAESAVGSLLERGEVTVTGPRAPGVLDVAVAADGRRINAVFVATTADAVHKELAAMKLDRLLGLGLVPATVEREVQGQRGVLQARPAKWTTEADVLARGQRGVGWCALPPQFELMYGFDALIGNEGRSQDRVLYDANEWNLLLTGHDRAFGPKREFPAHLQQRPPQPGTEFRRRLAALDEASLNAALEGLVGKREIKALLQRRDAVLAGAEAATGSRIP
jgi:Calcineurin-like phosphoesterase